MGVEETVPDGKIVRHDEVKGDGVKRNCNAMRSAVEDYAIEGEDDEVDCGKRVPEPSSYSGPDSVVTTNNADQSATALVCSKQQEHPSPVARIKSSSTDKTCARNNNTVPIILLILLLTTFEIHYCLL